MNAINFYPACGLNSYEGYGRAEIGFLKGAYETGLDVSFYPVLGRVTLQFGNPKWGESPFMDGRRRWLWSMIESMTASEQWVNNINAYYERLIVPAPDMIALFADSGVNIPIHYIPLGVDAFPLEYRERESSSPFTFLTYSYGDIRKGADLAVMAFLELYEDNPNYRLIIKARDNDDVMWLRNIQSKQISVIGGKLSEQALQSLWAQSHVFVFASRAEGFGMPPREAVMSGLPTIATRWLGMWDAEHWGFPLPVADMRPSQYMLEVNNKAGALWAEPDFATLRLLMQWIPENYEQAKGHTKRGVRYLCRNFTWRQSVEQFKELLEQYT